MKKLSFLFLVLIAFLAFACSINPKEIELILDIDEVYDTNESKFNYEDQFVKIEDGIIIPLEKGETEVVGFNTYKIIIINKITSLTLEGSSEVSINKSISLVAQFEGDTLLAWSSSDESIATINKGLVEAKGIGVCTIEVIDLYTNIKATKEITVVEESLITDFSLNLTQVCKVGHEIEVVLNYDSTCLVDFVITSSDPLIASVNNNFIKGLKSGTVTIEVLEKYSNIKKTIEVTIFDNQDTLNEIETYVKTQIGAEAYEKTKFPKTHPNYSGSEIKYSLKEEDSYLINFNNGNLEYVEVDKEVVITIEITYENNTLTTTHTLIISGYILEDMASLFTQNFKGLKLYGDVEVKTSYPNFGGTTVTWTSSNTDIFNNYGVFKKPFNDTTIDIQFRVTTTNPSLSKDFKVSLSVAGLNITEKAELVSVWIDEHVGEDGFLKADTVLPLYIDEYKASLEWQDSNGKPFVINDACDNPILSDFGVYVTIKVTCGTSSNKITKFYLIETTEYENIWDLIDLFVTTIADTPVTTFTYSLISWQSTSLGYVPFVDNTKAPVIVDILPYTYGKQRTNTKKASTEYIVIHDTGNPNQGANALAHNNLIKKYNDDPTTDYISWHYTIDEKECYQHLPLDEVAYHAGDGSHVYGDTYFNTSFQAWSIGGGNRNGIGIESCIDKGTDYTQTMRNMAKLVAELLIQFGLGMDRVKQHNNFSGKNCPQVMRGSDRWNEFLYLVRLEYFMKTSLKGLNLEWTSLTDGLSNTGKIETALPIGSVLNYKVKATYNGISKDYTFSSTLTKR